MSWFRFSPPATDFSLFALDKAPRQRQKSLATRPRETDEDHLPVPVWRTPQPQPHAHADHEVNLIAVGSCRYVWSFNGKAQTCVVGVGQVLVIPGGIEHTVEVDERVVVRGLWLHPDTFRRVTGLSLLSDAARWLSADEPFAPRLSGDGQVFQTFNDIWGQGQAELLSPGQWRDETLRTLGALAALSLLKFYAAPLTPNNDHPTFERIAHVKAWMERHALEKPSLSTLSEMAGLSVSRFSELFHQLAGRPPRAFLIECRLRHASHLLGTTGMSVGEIADMCGWEHLATFNHAFKDRFGKSPRQWRSEYPLSEDSPNNRAISATTAR